MWLLTPTGFYSAVAHSTDPEQVVVRSRALQDSEALRDWLNARRAGELVDVPDADPEYVVQEPATPLAKVEAYRGSDYPWRVLMLKSEWAAFLADQTADITYTNFKNEVTKRQGHARHDIYSKVWGVLLAIEKLPGAMKDHKAVAVEHPRWKGKSPDGSGTLFGARYTDGPCSLCEKGNHLGKPACRCGCACDKAEDRPVGVMTQEEILDDLRAEGHTAECDMLSDDPGEDVDCTCGLWAAMEESESIPLALDADTDPRVKGEGLHSDCTTHGCVAPAGYLPCEEKAVSREP